MNDYLADLKKLLDYSSVTFTPNTIGVYLKAKLYKHMDEATILVVLDEIIALTKKDFFDVNNAANESRMRSISFINQLKNIFYELKRKLEISAAKKVRADTQEKKKEKYQPYLPVTPISQTSSKTKNFEEYLHEADQDFIVGGPKFLLRAKERYTYILENFAGHADMNYVRQQLGIVQKQMDLHREAFQEFMTSKNAPAASQDDQSIEKNPPSGKIDQKTGKVEDDFA